MGWAFFWDVSIQKGRGGKLSLPPFSAFDYEGRSISEGGEELFYLRVRLWYAKVDR